MSQLRSLIQMCSLSQANIMYNVRAVDDLHLIYSLLIVYTSCSCGFGFILSLSHDVSSALLDNSQCSIFYCIILLMLKDAFVFISHASFLGKVATFSWNNFSALAQTGVFLQSFKDNKLGNKSLLNASLASLGNKLGK